MNLLIQPPPIPRDDPPTVLHRENFEGIITLTFDRPNSAANLFDEAALRELDQHMAWLEQQPTLRGLILTSAKESIFVAGADLKSLASATEAQMTAILELGQAVFGRLARLAIPKVAAIHGACLGGGLELGLACDWRVATPDKVTQLGLPEVQLGILPAWGGTTRLPRLVGLPKALSLILEGRSINARRALRLGVVDAVAPREQLLETARKWLACGRRKATVYPLTNRFVVPHLIHWKVRRELLTKTRGLYPAPLAALETAVRGLRKSLAGSQELERKAFLELIRTPAAQNLIRVFLLTERAKRLGLGAGSDPAQRPVPGKGRRVGETKQAGLSLVVTAPPIHRAAVIGAGVMGAGISQWLASRGISVLLQDISADKVGSGLSTARKLFADAVRRGLLDRMEADRGMDRIVPCSSPASLANVDLVIEAATEDLTLKRKIFRDLAARSRPETILATNTSALSIEAIAAGVPHSERVVGLHFFNPVSRMKLVEVARWRDADPAAVQRTMRFATHIGKLPVLVNDSPGFVVNRVLLPYLLVAGQLFDHGADPGEIDRALLEFGMPMGPLRLLDEIGLDVALHVAHTLHDAFPGRLTVPSILTHLVEAGNLGRKSGRGFFMYKSNGQEMGPDPGALDARENKQMLPMVFEALQDRLVMLMVNEAAYCLMEGVVQSADEVDFAMIMGAGFSPLQGGPLRYADSVGLGTAVRRLETSASATGDPLFAPCPLLVEKMINRQNFYARD